MTSGPGSDDLAESTLEAEERDDDSLIRAIAAAPSVPIAPLTPGTLVASKYRLVSLLGRGGMGVVWRANDERLDRAVAVKFQLGTGRESGAENEVERLRREARALASLSHPHVVTVLEVGLHEGVTTSRWSSWTAATRASGSTPQPRSWHGIVALYRQAGAGLVAAHRVGIVHRDFKPDNVLVGKDGRVRVADFGLARPQARGDVKPVLADLDRTLPIGIDPHAHTARLELATRTGALVGTPAYMAPEQLMTNRVDARADQFSFCVAVFEALYGERPFKSIASLADARVVPVPRGRITVARAPGWVLALLQRGLARDPDERFASTQELIDRLQRPPLRRAWIPAALVGVALVGVAVVGGEDTQHRCADADDLDTVWNADRATEIDRSLRGTDMPGVDASWARLRPRLDAYAASWSTAWRDACDSTDERTLDGQLACLRARRGELVAVIDLLAHADASTATNLAEIGERLEPPDACREAVVNGIAEPPRALAEEVAALREPLASAKAHSNAGHYAYAAALLDPIVARAHELGYRPLLAEALHDRGVARGLDGRHEDAFADASDAYSIALAEHQDELALSSALHVATALGNRGEYEQALDWCETTRAIAERSRDLVTLRARLAMIEGDTLLALNRAELATARIDEAVELAAGLDDDGLLLASAQEARAHVQLDGGRPDHAVELQRVALAGFVAALGAEHPRSAQAERKLGWLLMRADRREEGRVHMERARDAIEAAFGPDHHELVASYYMLAVLLSVEGDQAGSLAQLERARAIELRQRTANVETLGRIDDAIAIALSGLGRYAEAVEVHRRVLDAQEARYGPNDPNLRYDLNNLALAGRDGGRPDEAEGWFRRAIAIDDAQSAADALSPSLHFNLGFLLLDEGELDAAEAEFERARELFTTALRPDDPELAWAIMGLGRVALARGRDAQAVVLFEDALARWDVGTDRFAYRELQRDLVLALWAEERDRPRALALAREALAADPEHDGIAAFLRARAR